MEDLFTKLIVDSSIDSHLAEVFKYYTTAFYEICLNYDRKITKKEFFDFLAFAENILLPKVFSKAACHLHTYINFYNKTVWEGVPQDKRDLRKLTDNFDELIANYVGCCFNSCLGNIIADLIKDKKNKTPIFLGYEQIIRSTIESAYKRSRDKMLKEYEEFLEKERETLIQYN